MACLIDLRNQLILDGVMHHESEMMIFFEGKGDLY
jgi:hypothetical protein